MRDPNDIRTVTIAVQGVVSIDLERVQEDPQWALVSRGVDLEDATAAKLALEAYVARYLGMETLLSNAPFTNGPADVISTQVEVQ